MSRLSHTSLALALAFIGLAVAGTAFANQQVGANARLIEVPNTPVTIALWEERDAGGAATPYYAISYDGQDFVRIAQASYELGLRYAIFDPFEGEPTVEEDLAAGQDVNLYLVQFLTQPLPEYAAAIEMVGGAVRHYVAQNAYLVEMDAAARNVMAEQPYVRWIGKYHPAYRLEEFMLENYSAAGSVYPMLRYNIQVLDRDRKFDVVDRIEQIGGVVDHPDAGKHLIEATLTPEELFQVIRWDEVLFVDRWSPYEKDMVNVRVLGGANYIETVAGYTGAGVRGEVFDAGFNPDHHDFQSRPLIEHGTTGYDTHGAATSGINFGDGAGQYNARGLLPDGQGVIADYHYTAMTGPGRYTHTGELLDYEVVYQTASVGSNRTTQYSTISADTDEALFDFDIVHCQSQSNAGNQMSRPQAWAKNMISVGGVYHYNNQNYDDDCWCGGASTGPASDGRIKPDFTHFYDWIHTTYCCSYESYTTSFGGTSGATPIVAGHVGLLIQMWADGAFGNATIPGASVFENRPHMTTPKAILAASARQYDFTGLYDDHTRTKQGWGMPDLQMTYDMRQKFYVVDQTDILNPFDVGQHLITVDSGEPMLKIAMVYPDPPGNPAVQSQHRINDLTLRVVSPTGTVYYGNNGMYEDPYTLPGGAPDTKNTVECVFVETPEPGNWTVQISADEVIQDGFVETPELDVVYSLAAMGGLGQDWSSAGDPEALHASQLSLQLLSAGGADQTRMRFAIPSDAAVSLTIHDVTGRVVATLVDGTLEAGEHDVTWNGTDNSGVAARPGIYFARLSASGQEASRKLMIVQ